MPAEENPTQELAPGSSISDDHATFFLKLLCNKKSDNTQEPEVKLVFANLNIYGCLYEIGEPEHLQEALQDKNWKSAMNDEYSVLAFLNVATRSG